MEIHWIPQDTPGSLGVSRRPPGGEAMEAVLVANLGYVDRVVTLLEPEEVERLDIVREAEVCKAHGVAFDNLPVPDHDIPADVAAFDRLVKKLRKQLLAGERMVIHCNAGLGRAPTLACCLLVAGGLHPDEAVLRVGAARGRTVPEMDSQYAFIHAFAERQAASAARRSKSRKTSSVSPRRLSS